MLEGIKRVDALTTCRHQQLWDGKSGEFRQRGTHVWHLALQRWQRWHPGLHWLEE